MYGDIGLVHVIAQTIGWENPDPIHYMVITMGESTHFCLR
jgi:hypothetical protein